MPRSMSTTSARTPSACRVSSPVAKSVRMNRARHGSSAASSAKRCSAAGSRSSPMRTPSGPSRSAIMPACPPPPKVQSTATSPARGSRRASASSASTGTCWAVMSSRLTKGGGDVEDLVGEGVVVARPGVAVPDLQAVLRARDRDLLAEAGVLHERGGHHHAARAVELAREGVGGEVGAQLARLRREAVEPLERVAHVPLVLVGRPDLDALLDALGDDDAVGERRAELGRDGEPVLGIERVVEGAAEGHWVLMSDKEMSRDGGVGGAPPPRLAGVLLPHIPPQSNPFCTQIPTRRHRG